MPAQKPKQAKPAAKKKVRVSNEIKLDPKTPIPFEYGGQAFSFIQGTRYIPFLPPHDNFAQQVLEARLLSDTNNACIITKKDYCAGTGFQDEDGTDLDPKIIEWFDSINMKNEPVTEINKKIFEAFFTWGNVPIEVVKFSVAGKKQLFIYVHNLLEWRLGQEDADGFVNYAIQSKLFYRKGYLTADEIKKAKQLPIYNPRKSDADNWFKDEKGAYRTLIWYKNSVSGFPHYGMPSNIASMIHQILEYKGARYNLDNFENNMVVSALMALKGNLSQEEANRIGKQIINTHTGDGKRGRVVVVASEEGIDGSEFHSLDTHKDGSYTEADDKWMQKIILANQWDAILAGLISPSTMGKGAGFITKLLEIKQNTVIKPAQNDLITKVWKNLFKIAQEWLSLPFDKYKLSIANSIDISGLTDVDVTPAVQVNEVRKAKGLPEDPKMDGVYMKQPKAAISPQEGGDDVQN